MVEPGSISRSDDFTFRDLTISAMQHRANHDPTGHRHRPRDRHAHQRGHRHDHAREANPAALRKVLALTGAFLVAEVVGGLLTGSLALLSDAAHMFTDTAALAIALATARLAERPADSRRTFGYQRFEILAATVNAVLLLGVAAYVLAEGYKRLIEPPEIASLGVLAIAAVGLVVNLAAMRILSGRRATSTCVAPIWRCGATRWPRSACWWGPWCCGSRGGPGSTRRWRWASACGCCRAPGRSSGRPSTFCSTLN